MVLSELRVQKLTRETMRMKEAVSFARKLLAPLLSKLQADQGKLVAVLIVRLVVNALKSWQLLPARASICPEE